ncbi:MAG: aspartate-ammonia ligase [Amphiamblys sp. WSBS2006]|nr:MAG: aspartate-ammonia ligase [Amphiamblys sp. WSBS2006]
MNLFETEKETRLIKDTFSRLLNKQLSLETISAPIILPANSGLNDDLSGSERQIVFDVKSGEKCTIVQSLAKWKRYKLMVCGLEPGTGICTDMRALRRDEDLSHIHSYYVDQWDWETVIRKEQRTDEVLEDFVRRIYVALKETETVFCQQKGMEQLLPPEIHFVTTQELEDEYPRMSPKQREFAICKKHGAVFIKKIGMKLRSGKRHDNRGPDSDDWSLNGDILVYHPATKTAMELSSMGIRVDAGKLEEQLRESNQMEKKELFYHKLLLSGKLPCTIGGGIGQSRLCMFMMRKKHIGEVQVSLWDDKNREYAVNENVHLLA